MDLKWLVIQYILREPPPRTWHTEDLSYLFRVGLRFRYLMSMEWIVNAVGLVWQLERAPGKGPSVYIYLPLQYIISRKKYTHNST